jgi:hypothetical protein
VIGTPASFTQGCSCKCISDLLSFFLWYHSRLRSGYNGAHCSRR